MATPPIHITSDNAMVIGQCASAAKFGLLRGSLHLLISGSAYVPNHFFYLNRHTCRFTFFAFPASAARPEACAAARRLLEMRIAMVGWRECAGCKQELPEELFHEDSQQCRICARKEKVRNPVIKIAPGIVAAPREQWAKELIARLL
jgi:hypothetical protein